MVNGQHIYYGSTTRFTRELRYLTKALSDTTEMYIVNVSMPATKTYKGDRKNTPFPIILLMLLLDILPSSYSMNAGTLTTHLLSVDHLVLDVFRSPFDAYLPPPAYHFPMPSEHDELSSRPSTEHESSNASAEIHSGESEVPFGSAAKNREPQPQRDEQPGVNKTKSS